jgi:hypothetical protein
MTSPQIRAVIDDGPRIGDTVIVDALKDNSPPPEIMLPDGHAGMRTHGGQVPHPTKAVSRYRLVDTGAGEEYHYKVVPHDG